MPSSDIPIIGQPKVGAWFVTVNIECTCGKTVMLSGKPGVIGACPCKKAYRLNGMPSLTENGAIDVPLGVGQVG
jgi:hypothetical protein